VSSESFIVKVSAHINGPHFARFGFWILKLCLANQRVTRTHTHTHTYDYSSHARSKEMEEEREEQEEGLTEGEVEQLTATLQVFELGENDEGGRSDSEGVESDSEAETEEQLFSGLLCDDPDILHPDVEGLSDELPKQVPHQRVLRDPFHVINMIYVPRHHAFARYFRKALSLALFQYHPEDLQKVKEACERKGLKWEAVLRYRRKYLNRRVRRLIPKPAVLAARIKRVFDFYGRQSDPKTKKPLFNADAKRKADSIVASALAGEISDPPNVQLYTVKSTDPDGLPIYSCSRGTNGVEGGVHQKIVRKFRAPGKVRACKSISRCL
jgi:hypothetical protein